MAIGIEAGDGSWLRVVDGGGKILARYEWGGKHHQPFFHPVYTRQGPEALTCFAPYDHPWHKGLWWAWKHINGFLFWEHFTPALEVEGTSRVVRHRMAGLAIEQSLELAVVKSGEVLMEEERRIGVLDEVEGLEGSWGLDWEAKWTARVDCELEVTAWPATAWGGYAGLNYRPSRTLAFDEQILNSPGGTTSQACHGSAARWCTYGGVMDGDPDIELKKPRHAAVVMMDHPTNRGHPNGWYSWTSGENNRGFGFLATAPLIRDGKMKVAKGESFSLKYRVGFLDGKAEGGRIEEAWKRWVGGEKK